MKNLLNQLEDNIHVFLLARNEDVAVVDRRSLRSINVKSIQFMELGIKAASTLVSNYLNQLSMPDFILCHEQLKDITGKEFVELLQLHPVLKKIPLIMTITNISQEHAENMYYSILKRPYSSSDLLKSIQLAKEKTQSIQHTVTSNTIAFETALEYFIKTHQSTKELSSENSYTAGIKAIREKNWDEAITQLNYIVKHQPEHANALLALATAWKGKGSKRKYRDILDELLHIYVKNHQWEHAKTINQRLVQVNEGTSNPLYSEACEFLSKKNISDAAQALIAGRTPFQNELLYEQVACGCIANPNPQEIATTLQEYLKSIGEAPLAELLGKHLFQPVKKRILSLEHSAKKIISSSKNEEQFSFFLDSANTQDKKQHKTNTQQTKNINEPENLKDRFKAPSFLKSMPKLQDAISILKFTYHMFRDSKK
ncbi:chemotaxis protein CheY [Lawsonia intracellularis]|uniref:chemotaxis protein CheY n=1 Tax=Lawsonia intracellularis TaxID=29546 RepID=UPI000DE3E538|nr:chemotaxis protein CheY [Lawsonia intracellularis]RBN34001.1 chemotaxis protein CheY [Lawsonia intracellularis]RBN34601.1 chemotaxis protein CheY [Lawsonia intracellularis]UYH53027.1 chemotaxis protein CheY [Lawsonia intracellularis]